MTIYIKESGVWTPTKEVYIKDSGAWKQSNAVWVRDGGIWKKVYDTLAITTSSNNINLYTAMGSPTYALTAVVNISGGLIIGSTSTSTPAFDVGSFPTGSVIYLNIGSGTYIVGRGGNGGNRVSGAGGQGASKPGGAGGPALKTRQTLYLNNAGTIGGGGGGGGGGGRTNRGGQAYDDYTGAGGGGAGKTAGSGGTGLDQCGGAPAGTLTTGGNGVIYCSNGGSSEQQYGSVGGNGGSLGQAGARGVPNPDFDGTNFGGAAGNAIDGSSYTTIVTTGSILGGQVN